MVPARRCRENPSKAPTGAIMTEAIEHKASLAADADAEVRAAEAIRPGMIRVAGGIFLMGSDHHYPEERPAHSVRVDGFWIDRTPVNKREFRRFVGANGYVTFDGHTAGPNDYQGQVTQL